MWEICSFLTPNIVEDKQGQQVTNVLDYKTLINKFSWWWSLRNTAWDSQEYMPQKDEVGAETNKHKQKEDKRTQQIPVNPFIPYQWTATVIILPFTNHHNHYLLAWLK